MLNGQPIESRGILNGQLNESLRETFEYIRVNEGCNTTAIAKGLGKPFRTIDKHIVICRFRLSLLCPATGFG